jgi:putative FmdB family regulatory protein
MPIYAYRCSACGHAQDVLQKVSDPLLTHCPACGEAAFTKQVTAAGFQLKGSGWYATDFRNGQQPKAKPADGDAAKPAEPAADAKDAKDDKPAKAAADKARPDTAAAKPVGDKGGSTAAPSAPAGNG